MIQGATICIIFALWLLIATDSETEFAITQDYCDYETFAPSCADDEVIVVTSAMYGRLRTGKCIPERYASDLGCATDVLDFMNRQCSGRQSCSFPVHNFGPQQEKDCPQSVFRSYFEASYTCVKVKTAPVIKCNEPMSMKVIPIGIEGYISSFVTQQTDCGDADNPWLLTTDIGQIINITLIDFASPTSGEYEEKGHSCVVYATIREENGAVTSTVCGSLGRKVSAVFLSVSNSVEIRLASKIIQQGSGERHFLLKYTIEGCSGPDLPDNMWVKRFTHEALVGCKSGISTTWLLKCVRGIWEGQVGICSSASGSAPSPMKSINKEFFSNLVVSKPDSDTSTIKAEASDWHKVLTKDSNVILLSGSIIFISIIFFTLGIICIWSKYSKKGLRRHPVHVDQLIYGCKEFSYTRPLPPSYELYPTTTRNILPSTVQTTVYPFSEASSTYNTVNNRQTAREHIYESTFAPNDIMKTDENPCDDTMSEHKYFVLESIYTPPD